MPEFVDHSKKNIIIFLGRHTSPASGLWTYALSVVREISKSEAFQEYSVNLIVGVPRQGSEVYLNPLKEYTKEKY